MPLTLIEEALDNSNLPVNCYVDQNGDAGRFLSEFMGYHGVWYKDTHSFGENNCIIAGQVGFAGSSNLGDNVMIGGQAGISGHLKIGNNVKIGGGSGVVKDIPDNTIVMGYPAVPLNEFLKKK